MNSAIAHFSYTFLLVYNFVSALTGSSPTLEIGIGGACGWGWRRSNKKFVKSLKSKGFRFNLYDPWAANKQVKGEQLTVRFHMGNCKISHLVPKVIDETIEWL